MMVSWCERVVEEGVLLLLVMRAARLKKLTDRQTDGQTDGQTHKTTHTCTSKPEFSASVLGTTSRASAKA